METNARLYTLNFSDSKTYLYALFFVIGNILLPQLCHLFPNGGLMFLPIYFFTLIAAYKYGLKVGLLTAVLSPLINHLLFGMPPLPMLPVILIKSGLLAIFAASFARISGKVSLIAIVLAVLSYQVVGTAFEWLWEKDFFTAIQDFRIGIPGMLIQIAGGYLLLRALSR